MSKKKLVLTTETILNLNTLRPTSELASFGSPTCPPTYAPALAGRAEQPGR